MGQDLQSITIFKEKDFPPYLPKLNALYGDLFSSGKGFRSRLIQLVSSHLRLKKAHTELLAQTIEFIHNASLLHDDLVDRSSLRRNKTAAWLKYSPEYAVLAGDYLLARVMVNLSRHGNLRLIQYTSEIISDLLEGEWIQDSLVDDWDIGLDQLDKVHNLKTASLFKWCLRAPFITNENNDPSLHETLEEMGGILGLLFQRSDDLLDFNVRNRENKAVLGDLKAGYLNSFGAYLSKDFNDGQKERLKKCQTMDELFELVDEAFFQQKVEEFDAMNVQFIELFEHHVDNLEEFLADKEKGLKKALRPLPRRLYWRQG